uniref:Embryo surrounding factor 1 brassicaceae domain-containing protein n=1 Tax=Oryza punctata TaxID=4537 RepID=A0A0E0MF75_ORYPU
MKHAHHGLLLFCLVLLVFSAIPAQIRGQTTSKTPVGVSIGELKLSVCFSAPPSWSCCSKDNLCYPSLEACLEKCKYDEKARSGLRG